MGKNYQPRPRALRLCDLSVPNPANALQKAIFRKPGKGENEMNESESLLRLPADSSIRTSVNFNDRAEQTHRRP
jgi:hypothetical protein